MNQEYLNEAHLDAAEIPEKPTFSHSVKLEQTAKGVRVTVHVSTNSFTDARYEAVDLYMKVHEDLKIQGVAISPIEPIKNGVKV